MLSDIWGVAETHLFPGVALGNQGLQSPKCRALPPSPFRLEKVSPHPARVSPTACSSLPAQAGPHGALWPLRLPLWWSGAAPVTISCGPAQPARNHPPLLAFRFAAMKQAWASFLSSHQPFPEDDTNGKRSWGSHAPAAQPARALAWCCGGCF